ncbi:MAG TPA: hypothetical protein VI758_13785 [Bacteroidota bacterium]
MDTKEKAIELLLKPPAVQYIRSINKRIQENPDYVNVNRVDVGNIIHGFLVGGGILWHVEIFEKEWPEILKEALARLSSGMK